MTTDRISSPVINKEWGFTCRECPYVPEYSETDDFISVVRRNSTDPKITRSLNLRFPKRCKSCETMKKRHTRRKRQIGKVFTESENYGIFIKTYNRPKLITFALPSQRTMEYSDREKQIKLLDKKLPGARKSLISNGTLGGTYVIECTSRLVPFNNGGVLMEWKHHAHVHMVAVSNYVHHTKLPGYCEQLLPLGLGRINLEAPMSYNKVANYISKYLAKENQRHRSFGIMRGLEKFESGCRCKHEDFIAIPGDNESPWDWPEDAITMNYRNCECL